MAVKRKAKNENSVNEPLMAGGDFIETVASTRSRRNKAGSIERTDRYRNIDDGIIPFRYSQGITNNSSLDIRDTIVLCQKAYYNFSVFRNTIDLMTEFSMSEIYFTGGSRKSKEFFEALLKKININNLQSKFFREYYRSGNVFIHRFDANVSQADVTKMTQTFGLTSEASFSLPARYIILNPADIQISGNITFATGEFRKILSDYELERLRNPKTEEDKQVLESLDPEAIKQIKAQGKRPGYNAVSIRLPMEKMTAVFYKKQDYEPFAVPMGYPVLEDINWKQEMKKMDMALTRTTNQAILLVTMGAEPEKGGVNQKNLVAMQKLFENESVGRVLISDYTTKAQFVIPDIAGILDPKKYEVCNHDIQMGLNNILLSDEKFANSSIKVQVFMERLNEGRKVFINDFLIPEIKRLSKEMGFKNYPTPNFEDLDLRDNSIYARVYSRLIELGVLTPEEGIQAIESGRMPTVEESLESQQKLKSYKDDGLYEPVLGNKPPRDVPSQKAKPIPQQKGRPEGTGVPKETDTKNPIGLKANKQTRFSLTKIQDNLGLADKLNLEVESALRQLHNRKRLNKTQKEIAQQISNIIIHNEDPENWLAKAGRYAAEPIDRNEDRVKEIQSIAYEHQVDDFLAGILYCSKYDGE
tara:strand:+ start:381 stop:2306 length:1926 start_codon:yes stop_codon:yes gene_type:complete